MRHALLHTIGLALLLTACNGGGTRTHYVSTHLPLGDGAEMIAVAPGDGTVQVAVCRDGRLFGCEAVDEKMSEMALLPMGTPVDHPELPEWRRQLAVIDERTRDPNTDAAALVEALAPFPFKGVRGHRLTAWAGNDATRAGQVLDALGTVRLDKHSSCALVETALTAAGLNDARLAGWMARPGVGGQSETAGLLINAPAASKATWRAAIGAISHAFGTDRRRIYEPAAARLAASTDDAELLVGAIDKLYGSARCGAAETLLKRSDISAAFAGACLRRIDVFYGSDRFKVYIAAAKVAVKDPAAGPTLVKQVAELYGSDRAKAALEVIGWPETPAAVSGGYAGMIEHFYGSDRRRVLRAIIVSPGYTGDAQAACLEAAKHVYSPRERRKILGEIATSPRTTPALKEEAVSRLAND